MKIPSLSIIEKERKKQGLSQTELARISRVSQSLIARVEAGTVDPRYSKIKAVFAALDKKRQTEPTAKDMMTEKLIVAKDEDTVEDAVSMMKQTQISQMPIASKTGITGSLSEKKILALISGGMSRRRLSETPVSEIMDPEFPTISQDTPLSVITGLLEHNSAVIVKHRGSPVGIITNSDLLKTITNRK